LVSFSVGSLLTWSGLANIAASKLTLAALVGGQRLPWD
jgi:hypothetical protein